MNHLTRFQMQHFLAITGLAILIAMTFNLKDDTARGVLIGTASSSVGFFTGSASPHGNKK